jgi:hypothetical protein
MSAKNYRKSIIKDPNERSIAISWVLDAMKNVLGYEDVRKTIIQHYFPNIPNASHIRTDNDIQKIKIPKKQIDKYTILLGFYKEVLGIDDLPEMVYDEYVNIIHENRKMIKKNGGVVENLLIFDPVDVLLDMKPTDMLANE